MTDTTRGSAGIRGLDERDDPEPEGGSWEQRHIRVTFWLERTLPRGGPRSCQGLCAEHHAVHRPGSPVRRRRHEIAVSRDRSRLRVTGAERHPHRRFRRFDGSYIGAGPSPTSSEILWLTREGDVQGDVVCQPGSSKGALADRASRWCSAPLHGAGSGGRNLREISHLASEGDVQGDVARSSSSSEEEPRRWVTRPRFDTYRPSRLTRAEER